MSRQLTVPEAMTLGYFPARILPDGRCAGLMRMIYTIGLCVGLTEDGVSEGRYCFEAEDAGGAVVALATWDGTGDPEGDWIKWKGLPAERRNPNYKRGQHT